MNFDKFLTKTLEAKCKLPAGRSEYLIDKSAELGIDSLTDSELRDHSKMTPTQERECGDCTLCCVAPSIQGKSLSRLDDLPVKAAGDVCTNCTMSGCSQYGDRPSLCKSYTCLWALGVISNENNPMKTGICWSIIGTENGLILSGHGLDDALGLLTVESLRVMQSAVDNPIFLGADLRTPTKAISMCDSGLYQADIDPNDPLKDTVKEASTVKISQAELYNLIAK